MHRRRLEAVGFAAMAPAPLVAVGRASLAVLDVPEPSFYWVFFAIGGSLGGIGIVLVAIATYRRPPFWWVVAGALVAVVGHYVLPGTRWGLVGPSLVHVGTGVVLWPWRRLALAAGAVAGLGAYLRHWSDVPGNIVLLVGAAGLLAALLANIQPSD